jgi:hypothetical protein
MPNCISPRSAPSPSISAGDASYSEKTLATYSNPQKILRFLQKKFDNNLTLYGFPGYTPSAAGEIFDKRVPDGNTRLVLELIEGLESPQLRVTSGLTEPQIDDLIALPPRKLPDQCGTLSLFELMPTYLYFLLKAAVTGLQVNQHGHAVQPASDEQVKELLIEIVESPDDAGAFLAETAYIDAKEVAPNAPHAGENPIDLCMYGKRVHAADDDHSQGLGAASDKRLRQDPAPVHAAIVNSPKKSAVVIDQTTESNIPEQPAVPPLIAPDPDNSGTDKFKQYLLTHLAAFINARPFDKGDKYLLVMSGLPGIDQSLPVGPKRCFYIAFSQAPGSNVMKMKIDRFEKTQEEPFNSVELDFIMGEETSAGGKSYGLVLFTALVVARKMLSLKVLKLGRVKLTIQQLLPSNGDTQARNIIAHRMFGQEMNGYELGKLVSPYVEPPDVKTPDQRYSSPIQAVHLSAAWPAGISTVSGDRRPIPQQQLRRHSDHHARGLLAVDAFNPDRAGHASQLLFRQAAQAEAFQQ